MVERYTTLAMREGNREATAIRFATPRSPDMTHRIPEITAPTLILQGGLDNLVPPAHARRFEADIPDSKLVMFETVGHIPMEEIPAISAAEARAFLNSVLDQD
jgi:pimeloyl-ACP methyl ester carboxylesterase